jgi:hypothetical protein
MASQHHVARAIMEDFATVVECFRDDKLPSGESGKAVAPSQKQLKNQGKGSGNWLALFKISKPAAETAIAEVVAEADTPVAVPTLAEAAAAAADSTHSTLEALTVKSQQSHWSATLHNSEHMMCWIKFGTNCRVGDKALRSKLGSCVSKPLKLAPIAWLQRDFGALVAEVYQQALPSDVADTIPLTPAQKGALRSDPIESEWSQEINEAVFMRYPDDEARSEGYKAAVALCQQNCMFQSKDDCISVEAYTKLFNEYQMQLELEDDTADMSDPTLEQLFTAGTLVQCAKRELNYPVGNSFLIRKGALKKLKQLQMEKLATEAGDDEDLRKQNLKRKADDSKSATA